MPSIEDFVQDLSGDVKEVIIPKDKVTELSPGWYVSKYNLPHKGSKQSWRNGRLHAFDMGDHYAVHMDRVDPKDHSIGHLVEDAPFLLFLWEEFTDASKSIKEAKHADEGFDNRRWIPHIVIGIALLLTGIFIMLESALALDVVYRASALALLILGIAIIWNGLGLKRERSAPATIFTGMAAISLSVAIFFVPGIAFWLLLLTMAVWTMASGIFLIAGSGDKLQFSAGSIAPIVIGLLSLAMATAIFINPVSGLDIVVKMAGLLIAFIGSTQFAVGLIHGHFLVIGGKE